MDIFLDHFSSSVDFTWHVLPPHESGSILLGIQSASIDLLVVSNGQFHIKSHLQNKTDRFVELGRSVRCNQDNHKMVPLKEHFNSSALWHQWLGHPSYCSLSHLVCKCFPDCNKIPHSATICEACQLGRQPRTPFPDSHSYTVSPFHLFHCNVWTSSVATFYASQILGRALHTATHLINI